MSGDQWFTLWMTLLQTLGGGVVTLGGVFLGFRFSRRQERASLFLEADRKAMEFWIEGLQKLAEVAHRLYALHATTGTVPAGAIKEEGERYVRTWDRLWNRHEPLPGTPLYRYVFPLSASRAQVVDDWTPAKYFPALGALLDVSTSALNQLLKLGVVDEKTQEQFGAGCVRVREVAVLPIEERLRRARERLWARERTVQSSEQASGSASAGRD